MNTTQDLRAALQPDPAADSRLEPDRVLAAGRRYRRRRRALHTGAACAVVAALSVAAVAGVSLTGAPDPVAFASRPYVVSDEGVVDVGEVEAALSEDEAFFSTASVRLGISLTDVHDGNWYAADNLLVVVSTEPITRGTIDIAGRHFETTVVQFAERPEYRFAVVLLDDGLHANSRLMAVFTGTDDTGNVLVRKEL